MITNHAFDRFKEHYPDADYKFFISESMESCFTNGMKFSKSSLVFNKIVNLVWLKHRHVMANVVESITNNLDKKFNDF